MKIKLYLFFSILFALTNNSAKAQTTLVAGDIAITGYNAMLNSSAVNANQFSFIILRPGGIAANTVINFTDNGWNPIMDALGTGEGTMTWTASSALPQLTEVTLKAVAAGTSMESVSTGSATVAGNFILSLSGDQLLAYQGTATSPVFITGLHMNSEINSGALEASDYAGWDHISSTSWPFNQGRSSMPPGLTGSVNAIMAVINPGTTNAEKDNGAFDCAYRVAASVSALRASLCDPTKWLLQDITAYTLPTACTYSISPVAPSISGGPSNSTICAAGNTAFSVTASDATGYQWQVNTGSSFLNITNNSVYTGATTATLTITNATAGMSGYLYRCVVSGSTLPDATSTNGLLTVQSTGQWLGTTNSSWTNTANWGCGVLPTASTNVTISSTAPNMPVVDIASAICNNITVNPGAALTVAGSSLMVGGTISNSGTITANGGTISATAAVGTGVTNANGATFTVNGATVNVGITDNSFCNRTFMNNGTLTVSGGTLNMYGNITSSLGSVFNQSGGNINIDGNAGGVAANSVASGTALLQFYQLNSGIHLTGGVLTIVDPHASSTASNAIAYSNATAGTQTSLPTHTTNFGNGVSSDAGGNIGGFIVNAWVSTAFLSLGSITINGPSGFGYNRNLSGTKEIAASGNVTINSGGALSGAPGTLILGGDFVTNGGSTYGADINMIAANVASNTSSALTFGAVTTLQLISGSFGNFTMYNSSTAGIISSYISIYYSISVITGTLNVGSMTMFSSAAENINLPSPASIIYVGTYTLNDAAGATVSGLGKFNITGTATLTAGTLTTGGIVVLKSSSAGTASIATITGGSISGTVTTETYIHGGRRAFRFLGHPFSNAMSMSSLIDNIYITGTGGTGSGFDATVTNNPSSFWFDNSINSWTAFTSASDASWTRYRGARVLVRGDRTQTSTLSGTNPTPLAVTLDMTGTLNTGNQNIALPNAGNYHFISNPYPSPTNIGAVIDATAGIGTQYWVWNTNASVRGAYVTRVVGSGAYSIAMNSSFIVQPAASTTLAFTEANKTSTATASLFRAAPKGLLELELLYDNYPADNLFVRLNEQSASNMERTDGEKLMNTDMNFYTISSDNKKLSLDARPLDKERIIQVGVVTNVSATYRIRVANYGVSNDATLFLKDKYTNTLTPIDANTDYTFTVSNDTGSQGENRFEIIMKPAPLLATAATSFEVSVTPNPVANVLTVSYSGLDEQKNSILNILSIEGKLVKTIALGNIQSGKEVINIESLANGTYIVQLINGSDIRSIKIIKQ